LKLSPRRKVELFYFKNYRPQFDNENKLHDTSSFHGGKDVYAIHVCSAAAAARRAVFQVDTNILEELMPPSSGVNTFGSE
jgi:hypothetical protein